MKPYRIMSTEQKPKSSSDPLFYKGMQPEGGQGFAAQLNDALRKTEPRLRALFATAKPGQTGGAIILDRADPYDIAKGFVRRKYCQHGHLGLYYKGQAFWRFNGSFYEELEFDVLSAEVRSTRLQKRLRGLAVGGGCAPREC